MMVKHYTYLITNLSPTNEKYYSNSLKGKRWYNNGETRVYVFPEDKPAGFWPGLKLTKKDKNYE